MKTLKQLLLLTLITFISFSCSKDDDNDDSEISQVNLLGSWRFTKELDHEDGIPDDVYNVPSGCDELIWTFTDTEVESKGDYDCDGAQQ